MRAAAEAWESAEPVSGWLPATNCEGACQALRSESAEPVLERAQRRWAARTVGERLQVIRHARHAIAARPELFAEAISPTLPRSAAETLVTEVLPLLDAMRFLERRAASLLAPHKLGARGRPLWLTGVAAQVQRVPLGHILIIAPANYPLFLAGVQAVQALVAGNAVTWKPGVGGQPVALLLAHALREAGLPRGVLHITEESVEAAQAALAQRPDKVIFTGSATAGRAISHTLADQLTPTTMELSGADAVVVLPSADLTLAAKAIAFGLRLNGAQVCMSPRRLIATRETMRALRPFLQQELATIAPVPLSTRTATQLEALAQEAREAGAAVVGPINAAAQGPVLIEHAQPSMGIARTDLFAPVLSLLEAESVLHIADMVNDCPYALTAAIFGEAGAAETLGQQLRVGTVLVNDLIAPTVDPRVPFGGRGESGFGTTRGAEGLLEMTAAKTVLVRRKGSVRQYAPVGERELPLFAGLIAGLHGGSLRERVQGLQRVVQAARNANGKKQD